MKKSLMFPFLFAALLSLCACTQGTEPDAPTANAGITLTLTEKIKVIRGQRKMESVEAGGI